MMGKEKKKKNRASAVPHQAPQRCGSNTSSPTDNFLEEALTVHSIEGTLHLERPRDTRDYHKMGDREPNPPQPGIDPDRIRWLINAMDHLIANPYDEMRRSLQYVRECLGETGNIARVLVSCLANVAQYIDVVDYAKDFEKMGGFQVFPQLLDFPSPIVRVATCSLIAELVQNNPHCQRAAILSLRQLMRLVQLDMDDDVRVKALYAVSCMVRQNKQAYDKFEQLGGGSALSTMLFGSSPEKLKTKASFLVATLCSQEEGFRRDLTESGFMRDAVVLLPKVQGICREFLLSAMVSLASHSPHLLEPALKERLAPILRSFVLEHEGIKQFQEIMEYSTELLSLIDPSGVTKSS